MLLSGSVLISEFMAVNGESLKDYYGDYPDWIEIHNSGSGPVDLTGWKLEDEDSVWGFPDGTTLAAGEYRLLLASGRDLLDPAGYLHTSFSLKRDGEWLALRDQTGTVVHAYDPVYPEQFEDVSYGLAAVANLDVILLGQGDPARALVPSGEVDAAWRGGSPFDDSLWLAGTAGVGFCDAEPVNFLDHPVDPYFDDQAGGTDAYADLIELDLRDEMLHVNGSACVRMPFDLDDPAKVKGLTLGMKYDDGFVAWLNGVEIARRNAPAALSYDSVADDVRAPADAVVFEDIDVSALASALRSGENILAVQGLNESADSGGFLVLPQLAAMMEVELPSVYFSTPTPGGPNSGDYFVMVADTKFSVDRGYFDAPFDVTITTETPGAVIYYTTDGTKPTPTNGEPYSQAIRIETTTTLRAQAFKEGYASTNVDTETYIFAERVAEQTRPEGYPTAWGGEPNADYDVDPRIGLGAQYRDRFIQGLTSIPSVSLVLPMEDFFGPGGLYSNPASTSLEKETSAEWIFPDVGEGFQIDAGLKIQGGASRSPSKAIKHSLSLRFREAYGDARLEYPLFEGSPVERFDSIQFRAVYNNAWIHSDAGQRDRASLIRDQWMRDSLLEMGQEDAGRGSYVHLYVNGLYWGVYNLHERPEASHYAEYNGCDKGALDALNGGSAVDGTTAAWNAMKAVVAGRDWDAIQQVLDVDNYIDWTIAQRFGANRDLKGNGNWRAAGGGPDQAPWHIYSWDGERVLENPSDTNLPSPTPDPPGLLAYLDDIEEFRIRFADRLHKHLFNGGALTPQRTAARWMARAEEIDLAVVCESARWGDDRRASPPYTRDVEWINEQNRLINSYFPVRTQNVLNRYRTEGWYPSTDAPVFHVNGEVVPVGEVVAGDVLTITATAGTIYYTLDGADPRARGGAIGQTARPYAGPIELDDSYHVQARVLNSGEWSALNEAVYLLDTPPALRITEIMYNPAEPTPEEVAAGFADHDDFEFIELRNVGDETLSLGGVRFTRGILFTFPEMDLPAGQYVVVVRRLAAFEQRYGRDAATIAGEYRDSQLDNGGEVLHLETGLGLVIHDFAYDDAWYGVTDGGGGSLTIVDDQGDLGLWNVAGGWKASRLLGGTPGLGDDGLRPGSVVISEVLAHSDGAPGDWIELHNTTDETIDIGRWFLSDSALNLTKYRLPAGAEIQPGGYLVFTQEANFGPEADDDGCLVGFALSELGDDVYLTSNEGGQPGGYREHVDFGASPNGMTYGLHANSTAQADFTLLAAPSMSGPNEPPFVGPLVINEVMYHPAAATQAEIDAGYDSDSYFEFLELYNRSAGPLDLREFYLGGGVGFTFGWYGADAAAQEVWTLQAGATASWQASLDAGTYEVLARWNVLDAEGGLRRLDPLAQYQIAHAGGPTVVLIDQNANADPDGWVSLGTYAFDGPAGVSLTRGATGPDEWTIADALRFVRDGTGVLVDNDSPGFSTTGSTATQIGAGAYVVLVRSAAAFAMRYAGAGATIAGQYTGSLANSGEKLRLFRAGLAEPTGYVPYVREDYVSYSDLPPWPAEADGNGPSLARTAAEGYGNDPANWAPSSAGGTPGGSNTLSDVTPPSCPTEVLAAAVSSTRIDLTWTAAIDEQSGVHHYVVYRDGACIATSLTTQFTDTDVQEAAVYAYEVSAVNGDGREGPRSAAVHVSPRPTLRSAGAVTQTQVTVVFGEPVDRASAETAANYTLRDDKGCDVPIAGAARQADATRVSLLLAAPLAEGVAYTLTVTGVEDLYGSAVEDGAQAAFTFADVEENLIAWWPLDEGAGDIAHDATGHGHDAAISGATWTGQGRIGAALSFDGDDSAVDDDGYLNGMEALTIALWIKSASSGTDRGFFTTAEGDERDTIVVRYDAAATNASSLIKVYFNTDQTDPQSEGSSGTQTLEWQHVAITWTSGENLRLYIDGELDPWSRQVGLIGGGIPGKLAGCPKVLIGQGCYADWLGLIDDVRIYDVALSADRIARLANLDPVARGDGAYEVDQGETLLVAAAEGVLANDEDDDEAPQPLTASLAGGVSHGQLTLHADGSFEYTAAAGYGGADSFTYRAYDGLEYSPPATVSLLVRAVAPMVVAFQRNDGADRPSQLTSVAIRFSQDVSASLGDAALLLHNESADRTVDLTAASLAYDLQTNTARWDLSGVAIEPGYHTLSLSASDVTNGSGQRLGGGSGDDFVTTLLVALPGDANLDGEVNRADLLALKGGFGQAGAGWPAGDFDYNGIVDALDYLAMKRTCGRSLGGAPEAPLAGDDPPVEGAAIAAMPDLAAQPTEEDQQAEAAASVAKAAALEAAVPIGAPALLGRSEAARRLPGQSRAAPGDGGSLPAVARFLRRSQGLRPLAPAAAPGPAAARTAAAPPARFFETSLLVEDRESDRIGVEPREGFLDVLAIPCLGLPELRRPLL